MIVTEAERRFFLLIRVSDQCGKQINNKIGDTAMARMFDLANVLELIIDRLDQRAFARQQFVDQRYQLVLHVLFQFGDQLDTLFVEQLEQYLRDVAPIPENFAEGPLTQSLNRLAIIHVAGRDDHAEQFASVIDDQMNFEAIEPTNARLATFGDPAKDLVGVDSTVVADGDTRCVDE